MRWNMKHSYMGLCIILLSIVACSREGTPEAAPSAEVANNAVEPAAASPQAECTAVLAAHADAIQTLFDNARSLHPASNRNPVTPVADLRMDATQEQLSAIYGALHGNQAVITASAAVRGAERPIRVSTGLVNLVYGWNNTFTHTVAGQEVQVQTGTVLNSDTREERNACFVELVESYGDAGEVRIELTLAR